jgi:hypothetical protein
MSWDYRFGSLVITTDSRSPATSPSEVDQAPPEAYGDPWLCAAFAPFRAVLAFSGTYPDTSIERDMTIPFWESNPAKPSLQGRLPHSSA